MAYNLTYTIDFNNEITENIFVEIYRKDVVPASIDSLKCSYCVKKFINGQGNRFDPISTSELNIGLFVGISDALEFDDIIVSFTDEWKVILYNDGQIDFVGFLVPNECRAAFRDKPYDIELTATDGLGYLKDVPLTDINGNKFSGLNYLISYVSACLKKTLLDLDLSIYCNIYETSFSRRGFVGHTSDMFNQSKLDYRSFLTDATTFTNCYDALLFLLNGGFNLFQWYGRWVIIRCGEMQTNVGPQLWHTNYNKDGTIINATLDTDQAAQVAKQQILHPVQADQDIISRLANKSVKTSYEYIVWPEIPLNNKFERGTVFEQGPTGTGLTYKKSTINDWIYYKLPSPGGLTPTTDVAYRYSTYDIFNVEVLREIVLPRDGDTAGDRLLQCSQVHVNVNDKISITLDFKTSQAGGGTRQYLVVQVVPDNGSTTYYLDNGGSAPSNGIGTLVWVQQGPVKKLAKFYDTGDDAGNYSSFTLSPPSLPATGKLFVYFLNNDPPIGRKTYYKNFSLDYFPYVAGGYQKLKGDYWFTEQNTNYIDTVEESVGISDSPTYVLKGALMRADEITLTTKSWYRDNRLELLGLKEIFNIAKYNAFYKRRWSISGTFGGTMFHPVNDETKRFPLGFHKHFYFPNSSKLTGVIFQLVPPLEINYVNGFIRATFVECFTVGETEGVDLANLHEFKYIF